MVLEGCATMDASTAVAYDRPVTIERFLVWAIDDTAGFDAAWARIDGSRLRAAGRQVGQRPRAWWTAYELETGDDFVTERLSVESRWAGGIAALELLRGPSGWTVNGEPRPDLADALDCDLGECPLTNTMPVLRHGLLEERADLEFLMAFVEVPELRVVPSIQRYTHSRGLERGGAVITYRSDSFRSDLTFDRDGFVVEYPQLGRRLPGAWHEL
jgi:hypothetical protein